MKSTKKLRLPAIEAENRQEGKYTVTFDPYLNFELQLYIDAYKAQYPDKKSPKGDDLIVAIVRQHLAGDTDFARYKRALKQSAPSDSQA